MSDIPAHHSAGVTIPEPIAIVGIGCRLPGGVTCPDDFWSLLTAGVDAIEEVPADRWDQFKFYDPEPGKQGKIVTKWGGFVRDVDKFDAAFFGISPREAASMDPQQRMVLESAWQAMEDAGLRAEDLSGTDTAVFVGVSTFDYGLMQNTFSDATTAGPYTNTGQALSICANRLSYALNLKGPSTIVDTACSSSLLACHFAAESLWRGESGLAFVSGVNFICAPSTYVGFSAMGMLSPNGRCKAFDAAGDGFVRAEGVGTVILKPLSRAIRDGDHIYALVAGTACNQDGRTPGLTVPSQSSQEGLVRAACRRAGIHPRQVRYVEAHGTGTPVGDPIEARALGAALGDARPADAPCLMGSAKANVGHLEAGSGIVGLIKTALVLRNRQVPPNVHFNTPNPDIDFAGLRLKVPTELTPMPDGDGPAYAGINSFGFGGTNVHVVLREPPQTPPAPATPDDGLARLVPLSARSPEALRAVAKSYADALAAGGVWEHASLADIAFTAARRTHHDHRLGVVAHSKRELSERLAAVSADEAEPWSAGGRAATGLLTPLTFVFSGQGPQWWAMGRQLLADEPVFRRTVERCDAVVRELGSWSLLAELTADESLSRVAETSIAQPAIFAIQVGLFELFASWGVRPDVVVGHSVGEVAAAYAAGILSLGDAVRTIYHRGRTMDLATDRGRMLAVSVTAAEADELVRQFDGRVEVAAVNGPKSVTLSGDGSALAQIEETLNARGVFCRFLQVNYAFHSAQMDPVRDELLTALADLKPKPARLTMISTVTGMPVAGPELTADYWWRNVRQPVRFADVMTRLAEEDNLTVVELSPHPALAAAIAECHAAVGKKGKGVTTLRRAEPERAALLRTVATLDGVNVPVRWEAVAPAGRFVGLPAYPWQKESYWSESVDSKVSRLSCGGHPILGHKLPGTRPVWQGFMDVRAQPYAADHKIQGHVLMPGTGFVEVGLALGRSVYGDGHFVLTDVKLLKAAFMPEGGTLMVQTTFDAQTGRYTIQSQPLGQTDRPWTVHSVGHLRERPPVAPSSHPTLADARRRCPSPMGADVFYDCFRRCGFPFGPTFRGLTEIRLGVGETLGRVEVPAGCAGEMDDYLFHPAVLDACLQGNLGCFMTHNRPGGGLSDVEDRIRKAEIFMPSGYDEVRVYGRPTGTMWAYVRMLERFKEQSNSDVFIFDETGELVAEVRGFQETLVGKAGGQAETSDDLLYEYEWQFHPRPGTTDGFTFPPLGEVRTAARAAAGPVGLPPQERIDRVRVDSDAACAGLVWDALTRLGADLRACESIPVDMRNLRLFHADSGIDSQALSVGRQFTADGLADTLGVSETYRRLFDRCLGMLADDGVLTRTTGGYTVAGLPRTTQPYETLRETLAAHPRAAAQVNLLARCGKHLPDILTGKTDARSLLGSADLLDHLTAESPELQSAFTVATAAIRELFRRLPEGRTARVLHLRGGAGRLAQMLLPHLPADRVEFHFTDSSDTLFAQAGETLAGHPAVQYKLLDLTSDPVEQGFELHGYDLIVGHGAVTATSDMTAGLGGVKQLLGPDGVVLLVEPVAADRTDDLTFGLLPERWTFTDTAVRPNHPVLPLVEWHTLLAEAGFSDVTDLEADHPPTASCHSVLLARGPAFEVAEVTVVASPSEPGRWVLFADRGGVATRLAALLRADGQEVTLVYAGPDAPPAGRVVHPERPADFRALFADLKEQSPEVRGLIYLWALDVPAEWDDEYETELEAAQVFGAVAPAHLCQGWTEAMGVAPSRLWLVSRQAQAVGRTPPPVGVGHAPLWGFGRVIINEFPHLNARLIDLGTADEVELSSLADEIAAGLPEDEVALRGRARYVHRFVSSSTRKYAERGNAGRSYHLQLSEFGTLDGMRLRPADRRRPLDAPTLVEIEVHAAGLNFSDVMKALGLYPGLQEGFVPVGIECAGVITAVGDDVTEFAVGDEVVGIAPMSLASHAYTDHRLLAHKPAGVTMEEAATLPIAFLTAHYALDYIGRMEPGEKVLIHAATGGVGLAAIQLAQRAGAEVFATAGSDEKRDLLRFLGVRHVMDSRTLAFADEVLDKTAHRGVDLILNSLAGEAIGKGMSVLADYGRFLEIGKRDIYANSPLGLRAFRKNVTFAAIDLDRGLREKPDLCSQLFRGLIREVAAGTLRPLPHRVFPITGLVEAFRHMAKAKHTGKVVVRMKGHAVEPARDPAEAAVKFRPDATYLITGGLGGLGLPMAAWMIDQGARHLVLVGRHGANTDERKAAVERLRARGATVAVEAVDLSRAEEVAGLIARIGADMPPLRGVMHAAVVLDDGLIVQLTRGRIERVCGAKMNGAWHLHHATRGLPLEFFVCHSSTSASFGNPGQANYAAANAFLDQLAHHRRALGLPALTVNWGYLGEIGVAAGNKKLAERFEAQGVKAVPPAEGLPLLARLMGLGVGQIAVMRMDWDRMRALGLGVALSPRFGALVRAVSGGAEGGTSDGAEIRKTILAAAPERRKALLLDAVREKVARALGVAPSRIEIDKSLLDLGLDSLMGFELRNWIEGELRVNLPVVELMQGPTVQRLTDLLLVQLAKEETAAVEGPSATPSPADADPQRAAALARILAMAEEFRAELQGSGEAVDLEAEAELPADITPTVPAPDAPPSRPLLTGGTGFLGAYILHEWLTADPNVEVFCLVRAETATAALGRLRTNLERYHLWEAGFAGRIRPVLGDLSLPRFGLDEGEYDRLSADADGVLHNGAAVHFMHGYQQLAAVNVGGTVEALRFACHGRVKSFHHVSTLAVFSPLDHLELGTVRETDTPTRHQVLSGGYLQTKWVADRMAQRARERGLPVTIYRPAVITGDSRTGAGGDDVLSRLVASVVQVAAAPAEEMRLTFTPVDFVGRAIAHLVRRPGAVNKNFHLVNPRMVEWSAVVGWMRGHGYTVAALPYERWRARIREQSVDGGTTPLSGLLPLFPELRPDTADGFPPLRFECAGSDAELSAVGVSCPPMTAELMDTYLRHFARTGVIPTAPLIAPALASDMTSDGA